MADDSDVKQRRDVRGAPASGGLSTTDEPGEVAASCRSSGVKTGHVARAALGD